MRRKCLIAFTGIDGSGKTTQAKMLVESLMKNDMKVSYIRSKWEPFFLRPLIKKWKDRGTTHASNAKKGNYDNKKRKQKLLGNPVVRKLWLGAFLIDYGLQILIKIRSRLLSKGLIISDRIFYDSIIDQAINLGDSKDLILDKLDFFWMKILFPRPNIVFYIDCPENIAFSRKHDEFTPNIEYLIDRRKLYLELSEKYNWITIDGTLPIEDIAAGIKNKVYNDLSINR